MQRALCLHELHPRWVGHMCSGKNKRAWKKQSSVIIRAQYDRPQQGPISVAEIPSPGPASMAARNALSPRSNNDLSARPSAGLSRSAYRTKVSVLRAFAPAKYSSGA